MLQCTRINKILKKKSNCQGMYQLLSNAVIKRYDQGLEH